MARALLAISVLLLSLIVRDSQAQVAINARARELFRTGVKLLDDPAGPRYEEAYRAFRAAYREAPSPKILGNLGLCANFLERDGEAIDAYRRYLAEVTDIDDEERRHIERELAILEASAVPLQLTIRPEGAVVIDERRPIRGSVVTNRYEPRKGELVTHIRAGQHRIIVRREGHRDHVWNVEASPRTALRRTVSLVRRESVPSPAPPSPDLPVSGSFDPEDHASEPSPSVWSEPLVITGLTVSAATAAATAITMGLALSTHGDYEAAREELDRERGTALQNRGQALNLAADVLLVGTIVTTLATATMIIVWPDDDDAPGTDGAFNLRVGPSSIALGATW